MPQLITKTISDLIDLLVLLGIITETDLRIITMTEQELKFATKRNSYGNYR